MGRASRALRRNNHRREIKDQKQQEQASLKSFQQLDIPDGEKTILRQIPAVADGEELGTLVVYEDMTADLIVQSDLTPKAKKHLKEFKQFMLDRFEIEINQEEDTGGATGQEQAAGSDDRTDG